jgi:hypothetical protein
MQSGGGKVRFKPSPIAGFPDIAGLYGGVLFASRSSEAMDGFQKSNPCGFVNSENMALMHQWLDQLLMSKPS